MTRLLGPAPLQKSPVLCHFKTDEGHVQKQNPKVTKKPRLILLFFSPKKSDHSLSFSLPKKPFFSSLPLSSSPSPPPPEHHRHRNQSLPEKKGKTRQWIRKLKRAKDLFNINNTHCQCYHKINHLLICASGSLI